MFLVCLCLNAFDTIRQIKDMLSGAIAPVSWGVLASNLALYALLAYIVAAVVVATGRRWVKVVAYAVMLGLFLADSFLLYNYSMHLSPSALMLLGETSVRESREFLSTTALSTGSLKACVQVFLLVIVILILERIRRQSAKYHGVWALITIIIIICGGYAARVYAGLLRQTSVDGVSAFMNNTEAFPSDAFSKLLYSCYDLHLAGKEMQLAVDVSKRAAKETCMTEEDSLTIVLVVGESYIKRHGGVYGYALPTTPFMAQEREAGRLTVFTNAVAPYNLTSPLMRSLLCCNSVGAGERWYDTPYFPVLFKAAGFNVLMWDNQRGTAPDAAFTFALNRFLYDSELQPLAYSQTNETCHEYDGQLVDDFKREARLGQRNLVIFHLMGQHAAATDRYPHDKRFERFTADSIVRGETWLTQKKKRRIAEYDNATLYNDHVLSEITELFRERNTAVVYLSDHGEEMYDWRDSEGRRRDNISRQVLQSQYEVPMVVWTSETFRRKHVDLTDALAAAAQRPMTTDNVCHLLFRLGGMSTPYYHRQRDVLDSAYQCPPRLVEDSVDFDLVMADN